jgi:hypothetical protein
VKFIGNGFGEDSDRAQATLDRLPPPPPNGRIWVRGSKLKRNEPAKASLRFSFEPRTLSRHSLQYLLYYTNQKMHDPHLKYLPPRRLFRCTSQQ